MYECPLNVQKVAKECRLVIYALEYQRLNQHRRADANKQVMPCDRIRAKD